MYCYLSLILRWVLRLGLADIRRTRAATAGERTAWRVREQRCQGLRLQLLGCLAGCAGRGARRTAAVALGEPLVDLHTCLVVVNIPRRLQETTKDWR